MRVLHVSAGNLFGGVETLLVTLARYRHLRPEMEPHFTVCFEGRLSAELREAGVPVHFLGEVRASRPWTVWRGRRRLRKLLQHQPFEAVICHMPWNLAIFGPVVRSAGNRLAFWMHGPAGKHDWLTRWASRTIPELAICNSHFTSGTLSKLYPGMEGHVLYCPVSLRDCRPSPAARQTIRRELTTSADATVIIHASRMEPLKGHALLLEALASLKGIRGWVCWIAGGSQREVELKYVEELKETAVRLGIADRIRFLGERSDILDLFSAADIYCQPNTGPEAFGIAFIEALWAGLPVVSTRIGGAMEVIDESCGRLVAPGNLEALTGILRELIESRELRLQLKLNAPHRARELCDPTLRLAQLEGLFCNSPKENRINVC